jgi:uncharacterized protein (TIGR02145 family)
MKTLTISLLAFFCLITSCKKDDTKPSVVSNITIKTAPTKVNYYSGDALDLSGLVITIQMENGKTEDISFSEFESKGIRTMPENGTQLNNESSITILHAESEKNTNQTISVVESKIKDFEIKVRSAKTIYNIGESLDLSGIVLTITMNNNTKKDVTFADFSKTFSSSPANGTQLNSGIEDVKFTHKASGRTTTQTITLLETSTFTDSRDGQIYQTVKIGPQVWMAENLRFKANTSSWIYNKDSLNYFKPYGRYYLWSTAMNGQASSNAVPSGVQGVCPTGWHIPSSAEFQQLDNYFINHALNGNDIKENGTDHWSAGNQGTNSLKFSAIGSGDMYNNGNNSESIKSVAGYITSSYDNSSNEIVVWKLSYGNPSFSSQRYNPAIANSVRCLKN